VLTPEGHRRLAKGRCHRFVGHGIPHSQTGEAVGLAEGAQDHDVRPPGIRRERVGGPLVGDELDVGLVDGHQHITGDLVQELVQLALVHDRAGGVVRCADQDQPCAGGDRGGHCGEVVSRVRVERNLHRGCPRECHEDGIGLERTPGVDHLVTGVARGGDQLAQHAHAPRAGGDVLGRDAEALREGEGQLRDGHVRVTVHLRRGVLNNLENAGQWRVRVLVAADLVRRYPLTRGRRLARLVRRDGSQGFAEADGAAHTCTLWPGAS